MQVKDAIAVTDIWRVMTDDPGTKYLTVTLDPLAASFAGNHCKGVSGKPVGGGITVLGDRLRGVLDLFDPEAELTISRVTSGLVLKTKGQQAQLTVVAEAVPLGLAIPVPTQQTVPLGVLVDALAFLQTCVATSAGNPLITGVRYAHDKEGGLILMATDKEAHTGVVRVVCPEKPSHRINGQVVLPVREVNEFLAYLQSIGVEDVSLDLAPDRSRFAGGGAVMEVQGLQASDKFPNLGLLRKLPDYPHAVQLEPKGLITASSASTLLDTDRLVKLVLRGGRAMLLVKGQETGSFRTLVPAGKSSGQDCEFTFDGSWLAPVSHLGDKAVLHYLDSRTPVLFVGDNGFRLWMALVIQS